MIVKRNLHSDGKVLGKYLTRQADNERVEVFALKGTLSKDVPTAVLEMDAYKLRTKADYGLYHFQLAPDPEAGKKMTKADIQFAIDTVMKECNLVNRPGAWVIHWKNGRPHIHGAVQRYDNKTQRMDKNQLWARDQDRARRHIETSLGHKITPTRNPFHQDVKNDMSDLWFATKTEKQFIEAAERLGYKIAYGGAKRPFHVVDKNGVAYNLARKIADVKTADLYARLNPKNLPNLSDVTKEQKEKSVIRERITKKAQVVENRTDMTDEERLKQRIKEAQQKKGRGR